jgi:hypothetical protein
MTDIGSNIESSVLTPGYFSPFSAQSRNRTGVAADDWLPTMAGSRRT